MGDSGKPGSVESGSGKHESVEPGQVEFDSVEVSVQEAMEMPDNENKIFYDGDDGSSGSEVSDSGDVGEASDGEDFYDSEGRVYLRPADGLGFGVDIVEIARMKKILERTPSFARKVFSPDEQFYCNKKKRPESHYATRFAAKEAVVKALGTGFSEGVGVRDVEVGRTKKGRPFVILRGRAREIAAEQGVQEIPLSLSYTHTDAIACAMIITEESLRAKEEKVDPLRELAEQFKELRGMLDEAGAAVPTDVPMMPTSPSTDAPIPTDVPTPTGAPTPTDFDKA